MDSCRMLNGYASGVISARVGGAWTGPTRAPNLPPTRRLRSQSLRGPSLSNYARR